MIEAFFMAVGVICLFVVLNVLFAVFKLSSSEMALISVLILGARYAHKRYKQ